MTDEHANRRGRPWVQTCLQRRAAIARDHDLGMQMARKDCGRSSQRPTDNKPCRSAGKMLSNISTSESVESLQTDKWINVLWLSRFDSAGCPKFHFWTMAQGQSRITDLDPLHISKLLFYRHRSDIPPPQKSKTQAKCSNINVNRETDN